MKALRDHFLDEGNATRRIAVVELLELALHYKNKRSMAFEVFLTKYQKMLMIFANKGKPKDEKAKICFLFRVVQGSSLIESVKARKAQIATSATLITYTAIANYIAIAVADLLTNESKRRNISSINRNN